MIKAQCYIVNITIYYLKYWITINSVVYQAPSKNDIKTTFFLTVKNVFMLEICNTCLLAQLAKVDVPYWVKIHLELMPLFLSQNPS